MVDELPKGAVVGHYDQSGSPNIKFFLQGVAHDPPGLEYHGVVDTGFTGFLQIPLIEAFKLRLPLEGTTTVVLADGHQETNLTALGRVSLEGEDPVVGIVHLSPSSHFLVGMDFLRAFKKGLGIFNEVVFLLPDQTA